MKDYAAIATQYARDVVGGEVLACKWVRLACQRHLDDLERAAAGWRYAWNPELKRADVKDGDGKVIQEGKLYRPADAVCHFIELLPHVSGDWAARGECIRMQPWQVFVVASIFGWILIDTGKRRFRVADLFVSRKNAKSTIAAGIGLYMLAVDGEFGAEVYSGATSEAQAYKVFEPAKLMTRKTPEFAQRFGITVRESNLSVAATNSKFEPIIGKPGDGDSPSCAIVDEYHEHTTEDLFDTMKTGMIARSQPLLLVITTAGDDIASPCYAHQQELEEILAGLVEDERRFGIIFTTDVDEEGRPEDWTTPEAVIKANPNFGVSVEEEEILAAQLEAIRDPRKQATFQTKHLNMWVASASPWLPMQAWKAAGDKTLKLEAFAGMECVEGIDLANTTDIASRCKLFKRQQPTEVLFNESGVRATWIERIAQHELLTRGTLPRGWAQRSLLLEHYYVFWRHYLPEEVIAEPENKAYQGWLKQGWLVATAGSMIDQDLIKQDILDDDKRYPLREAAFDPWGSPGIIGALQLQLGQERVLTVPLQARYLSPAMKWIDGLLKDGRLHHNGDPVAAWAVNNVTNKPDQNDNWFPRKPASKAKKTDPAVAMIIATARAMVHQAPAGNVDDFLRDPVTA